MEVLKQISPDASPGAPQEVPANTAPSSSTSSAGTPAGFEVAARIFSAILLKGSVLSATRPSPRKERPRLGRERSRAHKMKFVSRTLPVSRYRPLKVVFEHKTPC